MRILLVNDFYSPYAVGGAETVVRQLAEGLQGRGHIVSVVTANIRGSSREERINGIRVYRIGDFPALKQAIRRSSGTAFTHLSSASMAEFDRLVQTLSPDVIHFHNIWLLGPALMQIQGYRKGVTFHDYWPFCLRRNLLRVDGSLCPGPGRIACRLCKLRAPATILSLDLVGVEREQDRMNGWIQSCDFSTAPSQYIADLVGRFSSVKIRVVRNGIPIEPGDPYSVREDFVLFAGRADWIKGISVLREAFSYPELKKRRLVMASDVRISRMANLQVIGWQKRNDLLQWMSRAACVVVPSLWAEPAPMVVLEAQSVGTPVIVSRIGGLPELLVEQKTGLTVRAGDVPGLVSAIKRICEDQVFQSQVRQTGPAFVIQQHSIDKVLVEWETIYASNA